MHGVNRKPKPDPSDPLMFCALKSFAVAGLAGITAFVSAYAIMFFSNVSWGVASSSFIPIAFAAVALAGTIGCATGLLGVFCCFKI